MGKQDDKTSHIASYHICHMEWMKQQKKMENLSFGRNTTLYIDKNPIKELEN